jgi:hypothetical protein
LSAAAALAVISSTGCAYKHHLLAHGGNANHTTPWKKTINYGWGARVVPTAGAPDRESCHNEIDTNGMHDIHISSNIGYSALTIVSLGLVSPVHFEWRCAPEKTEMGPTPSTAHPPSASSASTPASTQSTTRKKAVFTNRTLSTFASLLQTDAKAPSNRVDHPPPGDPATPANCPTDGMRQVKVPVFPLNYFYSLVTVATVGIWSPMHVAWQCIDVEGTHVAR